MDETDDDTSPPAQIWRVEDGAYAILIHNYDSQGKLVGATPSPVFALAVGPDKPVAAMTLRGWAPLSEIPFVDTDGCVHKDLMSWQDTESYVRWARKNVQ